LAFAQAGKVRTAARTELAAALQALIDEPDRLAAPSVRSEANALIGRAQDIEGGPVLRSQVARLQILLPEFDKPHRLVELRKKYLQARHLRAQHRATLDVLRPADESIRLAAYAGCSQPIGLVDQCLQGRGQLGPRGGAHLAGLSKRK